MLRLSESLVVERNPASSAAESVRSLRVYLRQRLKEREEGTALLFTSAEEGAGKTVLAANLAVSFAQEGKKVCIVDANLRSPSLNLVFHLNSGAGLSDYLSDHGSLEQIVRPSFVPNLSVIAAGTGTDSPAELLGGEQMTNLLAALRQEYEMVVLDAPGLLDCTDARMLASFVDGAVLVAKYGSSKRDEISKAKQYVEQAGTDIIGIVLNQVK